jgi:hypothetical protein
MKTIYTLLTTSGWILLRMIDVSNKAAKKIKTHCMFHNFLFAENLAVYEIMGENMAEPDRPKMTI